MCVIGGCKSSGPSGPGGDCIYSFQASNPIFPWNGGTDTITVTTQPGCSWSVSSNASWLTITSNNSGTGSGTVICTVDSNMGKSPRSGTITIDGQTININEGGESGGGGLWDGTYNGTATGSATVTVVSTGQTVTNPWSSGVSFLIQNGVFVNGSGSAQGLAGSETGTVDAIGNITFTISATNQGFSEVVTYTGIINQPLVGDTLVATGTWTVVGPNTPAETVAGSGTWSARS